MEYDDMKQMVDELGKHLSRDAEIKAKCERFVAIVEDPLIPIEQIAMDEVIDLLNIASSNTTSLWNSVIERKDFPWTKELRDTGFDHPSWSVRSHMMQRLDFPISKKQVAKALERMDMDEIISMLGRNDPELSTKNIEKLARNRTWQIRFSAAKHPRYVPDEKGIAKGLKDKEYLVRGVYEEREHEWRSILQSRQLIKKHVCNSESHPKNARRGL